MRARVQQGTWRRRAAPPLPAPHPPPLLQVVVVVAVVQQQLLPLLPLWHLRLLHLQLLRPLALERAQLWCQRQLLLRLQL